ncbi:hypothetical protein QVD17_28176 [Tagetes erecta]|uniref:Exonuclease domain-containing protein n=1 Tax=Tagetes erecta TaxID=13708 RepID=A0AAD8KGA1_TARER|nr:hypothetical protein QVD17_28176 [Tagetes erecta]
MDKIEKAPKEVLVDIVKLAQKRGMEGSNGGWKEFLSVYDKKVGKSLSDPARRSPDDLIAFVKTFSNADDLKFFEKVVEKHDSMEHIEKQKDKLSPEQELVHKTVAHPHYALNYSFPSHEEGWVVTKNRKKLKESRSNAMVAVDCEMALCEDGTDALVRVCVVDRDLNVKLDELVKPDKVVVDYRTDITGVSAEDFEQVNLSLQDVQESMKKLLSRGTILVGHSLNNDLHALKVDHTRVIDTSLIFKYSDGSHFKRTSLSDLCKTVLGYELRKDGDPHNCLEDARAAMKLVLAKIEGGVDNNSTPISQNAHETIAMKLLCHRIPIGTPEEKLLEIIPGEFTIEVKANKKTGGDKYSAFAVFKSKHEADEAYEGLVGDQDKDSSGLPQKLISFKLDSGRTCSMYVRKMVHDDNNKNNNNVQVASNKRPSEDEIPTQTKKLKTAEETAAPKESVECNNCDGYLKEIETLKKRLSERDQEISMLHKIIVSQARKQSGV